MHFRIKPKPPFNFELSASIFSGGDEHIRTFRQGRFWEVVRIEGTLVLVTIRSKGTVDEPELSVELQSQGEISRGNVEKAKNIVQSLFNLTLDLNQFYEEVKNDPVMASLVQQLRGLKSPTTTTVFEALIDSIIEQQISLHAAHSMQRKVVTSFGDALKLHNETYYAFPTPGRLASASIGQLRTCGLSSKKAEYIIDIAKKVANRELDLEILKNYEDIQEIIRELERLRGVGKWTAELTLIRGMQKFDAMPADDLGLRRCIAHYYCHDRKISSEEARKIARRWGTWIGLASFYVIMAERLEVKI